MVRTKCPSKITNVIQENGGRYSQYIWRGKKRERLESKDGLRGTCTCARCVLACIPAKGSSNLTRGCQNTGLMNKFAILKHRNPITLPTDVLHTLKMLVPINNS
jgi:hypothetical protein